jgi:rubrerythrin
MAAWVETRDEAAAHLVKGASARGEYRCSACGYGVTIYERLPRCPMCGTESWEELDWSPGGRTAAPTPANEIF